MDARDFAVLTLDEKRLPGMPRQAFKRRSPVAPADSRDRGLAEHIILGVVKNYLHLCRLIEIFSERPISQIDPRVRLILCVALYQMRFLERVPDHAAVAEAVRQTRSFGEPSLPRASGFVNAILRNALREPDVSDRLPSREQEPAGYAELVLSHPQPLFEKFAALLGTEDALRLCEHDNRTPPTLVRLAHGHTPQDLVAASQRDAGRQDANGTTADQASPAAGSGAPPADPDPLDGRDSGAGGDPATVGPPRELEIAPHEQPGIVVVSGARQADFARWSALGLAQVQDATSAAIVGHLDIRPGMTVLDRCCGVGTKTQQLAESVGATGRVFAVDSHGARITTLRRLISRRPDLANVTARRAEWMGQLPAEWPGRYERIIIDAPCSNSGVLARRAEARYADPTSTAQLVELQLAILRDTWASLADDGRLAFATCSIFPEENQELVRRFLAGEPAAAILEESAILPSFGSTDAAQYRDGGYVAVLRRG